VKKLFLPLELKEFKRYKKKKNRIYRKHPKQTSLLGIIDLADRQIKSYIPKFSVSTKNVVIFGVHTYDQQNKILEALLERCNPR
jgi:hypothetical protein